MFSHVLVGTNDLDRDKAFFEALFATLGVPAGPLDRHRIFWRAPSGTFSASLPIGHTHGGPYRMPLANGRQDQ